jgi:serine/threonine protein kinase
MNEMIDMSLGKYEILEEIGSGGFATVYRAVDTTLDREVALKVLDPLLMRDEAFVERFQREARAAASLEHPNIVPIYEVGEGDGRLFIAMRLVRGPSLAERLEEMSRIPWDATLEILRPVCDALAYAHEEGVVHRDIKPHNILLDGRSGPMLSDFGFARLVGTSSLTQSLSGGIVGTPAYIAPEIWEGVDATPATDVYALACVTYEMLTGDTLFGGKTPMAVMRAHDRGAELPEKWPIDVPQDVRRIMKRALDRQPDERFSDVPGFLKAMEDIQTAAVAQRIAAKVERLLDEMKVALDRGEFAEAVVAGEELLELESSHEEGARLLGQAQTRLSKQREFAAKLKQERHSLKNARSELADQQADLLERLAELRAQAEEVAAEREDMARRLEELDQEHARCRNDENEIRTRIQALDEQTEELDRRGGRLDRAAALLEQGDLQQAETVLAKPPDSSESRESPDHSTGTEGEADLAGAEKAVTAASSKSGLLRPRPYYLPRDSELLPDGTDRRGAADAAPWIGVVCIIILIAMAAMAGP